MKFRIAIWQQLAALVVFAVLIALAVVSIPTWIYVNSFVSDIGSQGLSLTASLKAARIASELDLLQTTCQTITSRLLVQKSLRDFYSGNNTAGFAEAEEDLQTALNAVGLSALLQARVYPRNSTGNPYGLLNVTGAGLGNQTVNIELPYLAPDGSRLNLSDTTYGYPTMLYPNITYVNLGYPSPTVPSTPSFAAYVFPGVKLTSQGGLILGPLVINETFALVSLTAPVYDNKIPGHVLGYLTLVASAQSFFDVAATREGLGKSGVMLLVGPSTPYNRFDPSLNVSAAAGSVAPSSLEGVDVHFVLPPPAAPGHPNRHARRSYDSGHYDEPFLLEDYGAILDDFSRNTSKVNNARATLSTRDEQGKAVAVGVARPESTLVSWAVVVEQDRSEAYAPISKLRKILLGCVFATLGFILVLIIPCARLSVRPIQKLKSATEKSVAPPGYENLEAGDEETPSSGGTLSQISEKGLIGAIRRRVRRRKAARERARVQADNDPRRNIFKIPATVADRDHIITDELTELTAKFNEMTAELFKQYTQLDEKVAERTRELEISKKAAEAANESKTLFIANISHELKTPLNGIMGMCAVCMEEDDIVRIKQSLKVLYKSGDLLLHLLEDLLSFSKNQIGHQVSLEEREFRLGDVKAQVLSIFDKQIRENDISFSVSFMGMEAAGDPGSGGGGGGGGRLSADKRLPALGPNGGGRLKDMCVWGDQHRILQVIINLVGNSLKFTPAGGKVSLRMRCVGEVEQAADNSRSSSFSRNSKGGRPRHRVGSGSTHTASSKGATSSHGGAAAVPASPADPKLTPQILVYERPPTPPPPNTKTFLFEFEVEDTGPGIAEHMQSKIFEPFVQGDPTLSKKFGGTGLGLSICAQLAKLMGGTIGLRSTLGVGTTFTMQIPLKYTKDRASSTTSSSLASRPPSVGSVDGEGQGHALPKTSTPDQRPRLVGLSQPFFTANPTPPASREAHMAAIDRAMANKAGRGKLRVLVADDNSTNIEVVSKMLKLEDVYDVTIATDGQQAYDLVKANMEHNLRFDVIFMDIQMPNLDGLQSTRLIRKMGYSAPIVALTAFSEESNVQDCIESGMDEFLSKPIRRPALKQVLRKFATIPEEPETHQASTRPAQSA